MDWRIFKWSQSDNEWTGAYQDYRAVIQYGNNTQYQYRIDGPTLESWGGLYDNETTAMLAADIALFKHFAEAV